MSQTSDVANLPLRYFEARSHWRLIDTAFWLATLLPFLVLPNYLALASQIAITGLFVLSIDLILGYAGIVSLGHAAFFGLGSYAAGLFAKFVSGEPLIGLVFGAAVAGIGGYLSSFVVVRFRHLAVIMITLGIGLLLREAANSLSWLTGGADGLQGVRMRPLLGVFAFDLWGYTAYCYSLIVLFLVFLMARQITNSPFGLALRGIRDNWNRMTAIGAPSLAHLRKIYTFSAGIAGIAGALLAQTTETVSLETLGFERSAEGLVMLVLGGAGKLYGGVVGAIIFMVARDRVSGINPQYWYFWIGLLLVAIVMFMPKGVLGGLARVTARWRRETS
jgi:branched-chain amino acid transport system permease protein